MNSGLRSFLAVILSLGVLILWYTFVAPPKPVQQNQAPAQEKAVERKAETGVQKEKEEVFVPGKEVTLENELVKINVGSNGGTITGWELKKFTHNGGKIISLAEAEGNVLNTPLKGETWPTPIPFQIIHQTPTEVQLGWKGKEGVLTKRFYLSPNSYQLEIELEFINKKEQTAEFTPVIDWGKWMSEESPQRGVLFFKTPPDRWQAVSYKAGDFVEIQPEKVPVSGVEETKVAWIGAQSRYFLGAVLPLGKEGTKIETEKYERDGKEYFNQRIYFSPVQVLPGESWSQKFKVYGGPKDYKALKDFGVGFDKAIGYGWTSLVAVPILHLLKLFYQIVHNYGLSIILLTVLIKLLLNPINRKSLESMKGMQSIQPKLKEIREKYGNDKERLNLEMMNLFKANKINPMSGCLPMLVQIPIYIALYKVLWSSVELYHAPFFWFYRDLSAPDPYLVTPLLLGVTMFIQTKMTPSPTADPAQQKIMMLMPLMFCAFMIFLPMGLGLYILVNTLMTILQQWMYKKGIRMRDLVLGRAWS